jgi:hypothetical protein
MDNKNNTGVENSGNFNSGNFNSGNRNSGNRNSGDWNSGDWNSGDRNNGYWNSGNGNSGNFNSGNFNSGNRNSGNRNSGYRNSGDWNSGDRNNGYFNTGSPNKIQIFNQWVEMTNDEFEEKYSIYADIPLNRWVDSSDMTEQEIKDFPEAKQIGGYLKTLPFKEACVVWWNEHPERHKDFLELPHFNKDIFFEITGINVDEEVEEMTMDEVCKALGKTIKIKK